MAEQIVFDRSLYPPEAVEAAVEAFREHAQIELTQAPEGVVAAIGGVTEDEARAVAHAFGNYVLHESIARRRQSAAQETD